LFQEENWDVSGENCIVSGGRLVLGGRLLFQDQDCQFKRNTVVFGGRLLFQD